MIAEKIIELAINSPGLEIPKPAAKAAFRIKGIGKRRQEKALIYTIPSHTPKVDCYFKGVTLSEFEKAYSELKRTGLFTREWFNSELPDCAKEGGCNFTTIGGIFEILGLVKYFERGKCIATNKA